MDNKNQQTLITTPPTATRLIQRREHYQSLEQNPAALYLLTLRSEKSREVMIRNIKSVTRLLGYEDVNDVQWEALRHTHIQMLIIEMQQSGLAPNTINTYLSALKGILKQAWLSKLIDPDDYQRIKALNSVRGRRLSTGRALQRDEIKRLFLSCDADDNTLTGKRDSAIIALMVGCGFRRSEIININIGDVDIEQNRIRVTGKGNKDRANPLPEQLLDRLSLWLSTRKTLPSAMCSAPLFVRVRRHQSVTCDRLNAQSIYYILNKRGVSEAIAQFSPHDLRRTFATALFDSGQDIRTVQVALGHENIETTAIYDKSGDKRKETAIKGLRVM